MVGNWCTHTKTLAHKLANEEITAWYGLVRHGKSVRLNAVLRVRTVGESTLECGK